MEQSHETKEKYKDVKQCLQVQYETIGIKNKLIKELEDK